MRYANTDALRDDLTACAERVMAPSNLLDRVATQAHRLRRRRRVATTAATGAAVGAGIVVIPLVRVGGDAAPARVIGAASASPSDSHTPEPTSSHHPVDPTAWPCGATGWDGSLVRSAHGQATPEEAVRAAGYGTGRFSARYDVRPGTVGLREYDATTGKLLGVYTIDRLDDGSWSVHSSQREHPCP